MQVMRMFYGVIGGGLCSQKLRDLRSLDPRRELMETEEYKTRDNYPYNINYLPLSVAPEDDVYRDIHKASGASWNRAQEE